MPDRQAIVVGAGVAGLLAGVRLARAGHHPLVLEAAAEPGGCVRWHTVAGLRLDRGADSFATARPAVGDLARELDLPVERPWGGAAWVRHEAGQAPLPAATLLGIPANPFAADVQRVIGRPGAVRAAADRLLPVRRAAPESLGALVGHRMGGRVLRRLVEPVAAGVYSTDPADLDLDAVAPGLRAAMAATGSLARAVATLRGAAPSAGGAVAGLTGGMGTLTAALVSELSAAGGELVCAAPVVALRRAAAGWTVTVDRGAPERVSAPLVVLAVPAAAAARLLAGASGGTLVLPAAPPTEVLLATLVVDEPALDAAPCGTGMLVSPRAAGVSAKALTHATAKWRWLAAAAGAGRHVLRLSYGRGGQVPDPAAFPDLALADAADLLGVPLHRRQLVGHAVVRYPDQLAARRPGQADAMSAFRAALGRWPGLAVTGSAVAGTGLAAVVADATALRAAEPDRVGEGWGHDTQ